MTPAEFGIIKIQSFLGSFVQPYMTQIKQDIAADKGWKGWALVPCKLAIICGM